MLLLVRIFSHRLFIELHFIHFSFPFYVKFSYNSDDFL